MRSIDCQECLGTGKVPLIPEYIVGFNRILPGETGKTRNITFTVNASNICELFLFGPRKFTEMSMRKCDSESYILKMPSVLFESQHEYVFIDNIYSMPLNFDGVYEKSTRFFRMLQSHCNSVYISFVFDENVDPSQFKLGIKTILPKMNKN